MFLSLKKETLNFGLHENLTIEKISVRAFCKPHTHLIDASVLRSVHIHLDLKHSSENHNTTFRKHAFHRQFKDVCDLVIMNNETQTLCLAFKMFMISLNIR